MQFYQQYFSLKQDLGNLIVWTWLFCGSPFFPLFYLIKQASSTKKMIYAKHGSHIGVCGLKTIKHAFCGSSGNHNLDFQKRTTQILFA